MGASGGARFIRGDDRGGVATPDPFILWLRMWRWGAGADWPERQIKDGQSGVIVLCCCLSLIVFASISALCAPLAAIVERIYERERVWVGMILPLPTNQTALFLANFKCAASRHLFGQSLPKLFISAFVARRHPFLPFFLLYLSAWVYSSCLHHA